MDDHEKAVIAGFASGDNDLREEAVTVYLRHLKTADKQDVYMSFMREVVTPVPDLLLRAQYRQKILSLHEPT